MSRIQGKEKLDSQKELTKEKIVMDLCDKLISLCVDCTHNDRITQYLPATPYLPPLHDACFLLAPVGTGKGHLSYPLIHVSLSPAAVVPGLVLYLQR